MRFVCDEHIVAPVLRALRDLGHDAWSAQQAGLAGASDEDLAVYASNRAAILVTHDREFSGWRKAWLVGHHVRLACRESQAAATVRLHLGDEHGDCERVLQRDKPVWLLLSVSGYQVLYPSVGEFR